MQFPSSYLGDFHTAGGLQKQALSVFVITNKDRERFNEIRNPRPRGAREIYERPSKYSTVKVKQYQPSNVRAYTEMKKSAPLEDLYILAPLEL